MTRSVPPRTRVVAKVCRRTCTVVSSSRPAAVAIAVTMSWAPLDAEALAALVEEQGGAVVGAGPVGVFAEPAGERGVQLRVDRDLPDAFALVVDPQDAFAGRAGDVVDVEGDDLADPGAGVKRDERERLVKWRGAGLDCTEVAELGALVERAGRGGGDLDASGWRVRGRGGHRSRPRRQARCSRSRGCA